MNLVEERAAERLNGTGALNRPARNWLVALLSLFGVCLFVWALPPGHRELTSRHGTGPSARTAFTGLPLPSRLSVPEYEAKLFEFLNNRRYADLGWLRDKGIRDTGPYIGGKSYGTHPAVRVYYSPGVMRWLLGGRVGRIPDGEMIVKEQFAAPAARHERKSEEQLYDALDSWTVMVKDSSGSRDGWFWSNPTRGQCVIDNRKHPFAHAISGFGLYCVRCHAAAQSPGALAGTDGNEFTFASLRNITGFPGEPIRFRVDDSWRQDEAKAGALAGRGGAHPQCTLPEAIVPSSHKPNGPFLNFFGAIQPRGAQELLPLPPMTEDPVLFSRGRTREFATSDQCMSCHAGLTAPFGPSMFVPTGDKTDYGAAGWDVSPYGEWRWTPMALAGRDPIFYAQLESEIRGIRRQFRSDTAQASELGDTLTDACLRCHGVMGKRQFDLDHGRQSARFSSEVVTGAPAANLAASHDNTVHGALARDGVSCMICHRMRPASSIAGDGKATLRYFLENSITGGLALGPPGELYGPYKDQEIAPYAMEHATGWKPRHSDFLKSSQLCGTCHTIALPALEKAMSPTADGAADPLLGSETIAQFRGFHHHMEQATYLEWLNSEFENEIHRQNPKARTCQDCHMSAGLRDDQHQIDIRQLRTRIAAIQDASYPEAENLASRDQLDIRVRDTGYRRHNFSGLNVFLLEMFEQFDDVLGVRKTDFMTGSREGIPHARDHFLRTAREDVASLDVRADWQAPGRLTTRVVVHNKVGHRFPSGVGFRRAFLELLIVEPSRQGGSERIVWASGRTNALGIIVGADGQPLATEFFARDPSTGRQTFQKHHDVITSPDQVQVYETLRCSAKGDLTTSFVFGCEAVKDNRLLPRGWKRQGPGGDLTGAFLEATYPDPDTAKHPRYTDGSGSDEVIYRVQLPTDMDPARLQVKATLYYQAIPPYFLRNLFQDAPDGAATRRLHYLCSHLNLAGTPIENWKLRITSATCGVR